MLVEMIGCDCVIYCEYICFLCELIHANEFRTGVGEIENQMCNLGHDR